MTAGININNMRRTLVVALALAAWLGSAGSAFAWGFAGHRLIMRRALELLPPELKPFFETFKDEIIVRVVDPDTWRSVGWDDDPNHFVDFGVAEYGAYPFQALPREYGAALEKFGEARLQRNGLLPWREAEEFGNLRRSFEEFKREMPYTTYNVVLFSAVASHYIQDAYQPFHATDNFDGQQTGNNGIHSRFERDLIDRYASRLKLTPQPVKAIGNIRDAAFDALLASYLDVDPILKADREALGAGDTYDEAYFEKFFTGVQPMLERQLSAAITATASVIVSAWDQAGRPTPRLTEARPVQKALPQR
jgi:hypothetical protein